MFSSDQNVESIARLLENAKNYGNLRLSSFEHSTVDKLTTIITGLIMGIVILLVSFIVVVFVSAAIVVGIAPYVGGYLPALLIISAFYTIILLIVYGKRQSLIATPLKTALNAVFFAEKAGEPAPTAEQMEEAKQAFVSEYSSLTAPPPAPNNRFEQAMQTASKAWSIADGLILGYKLYRKFGSFFSRSGKKKRK